MKKNTGRKFLTVLLSLLMMVNMFIGPVYADQEDAPVPTASLAGTVTTTPATGAAAQTPVENRSLTMMTLTNPVWDGTPLTADPEYTYSGGTGAAETDPYQIDNSYDLAMLAANVNAGGNYSQGKFFKLTANIVLNDTLTGSPKKWTPIGVWKPLNSSKAFKGSFDGNGYTIKGVYTIFISQDSSSYQGLFGYISGENTYNPGATVKNVGIIGSSISGGSYVGGIVGFSENNSSVENCYNVSPVTGRVSYVGGIVGYSEQSWVKNCYNTGDVAGDYGGIGGLVGGGLQGRVKNCYNIGDVNSGLGEGIGGVGGNLQGGSVENCYNTGNVSGYSYVGGLVGKLGVTPGTRTTVKHCVSLGQTVTGYEYYGRVVSADSFISENNVEVNYAHKDMKIGRKGSEHIVTSSIGNHKDGIIIDTPQDWYTWFMNGDEVWNYPQGDDLNAWTVLPTLKAFLPDGPALTGVTRDDATDTMTGMTAAMEFSTDGITWTAYNETTPNLPDLSGTVALQVRVAETATHTAGAPTTFYFTAPTLSSIAITTPATKTVYKIGEILDITGMVVTGTYSDNSTKEETITSANISGFDSSAVAATQTLTVTVGGKTVTYTIAVVKADNPTDWKGTIPAADLAYTYSGGTGADEMHPYLIANSYDLAMLAANVNAGDNYSQGKFFKLTADIVLNDALDGSPKAWTAIGVYALNDSSRAFKGSFDGNGHTVKGVYISNSLNEQGLFGYISGATVKNVGIIGSSISGNIHVGGIVGNSTGSKVENCYNTSPVAGNGYVGGVVGGASNGNLVKNCYNTNAVTGTSVGIGGVAGIYTGGSIENCYNTGNVSGASTVGGVVGILQGGGAMKNCVSLGQTVNGTSPVGRVISGLGNGGTVTNSYARKDMKIGATGSEVVVTGGAADNQNGADLTVSTATPQAWGTWFSDTAAWDITGVGNLVGGANLPILKDFSAGQNPTLPGSIQADTYTLTVNLDGGNSGITGGNYIAGAKVAINAGTKAGHTFSGWTTSNGGTFENATLTSTNFTMPANEVTITAQWTVVPTTPTYTVTGAIKDTNNNPVSGATVTLTDPTDSSKTYTGTTDANGNYSIPSVPDASYTVSVTKGSETLGSGSVTVNGSNVSGGSGNITVTPPTITTAQTPVFSASNVRGIEAVTQNANATELSVTIAAVTDSGTISYQWYKNTTNLTTGGTPISGATSSSYTPPTDTVGTTYYYVVVTNTATVGGETKTSTNTSSIKKVIVLAAPAATYDVSSGSSLSNITLDDTSATQYQNYTTTLSAANGYTLPSSITITMGGVTLVPGVDYIYSKETSVLTVYNVTGELSITAVGVLIPTQTYTITFNTNGGSNVGAMSGTNGTAISLPTPTKPGYNFVGWYKDSSFATSYLATTMGAENITLHAKWEQLTYTVTGNVKDENNANVESATVKLMAGSRQVAQATTDANGVFSISGVPSGIYNLVISKGTDQIITLTITVSGDIATGSVTLPKGKKNSVVEVKSGTPDIIVDKLNDFFASNQFTQDDSNVIDVGGTVEIRLIVEQRVESGDNAAENAQSIIAAAGSGKEIGVFLNLSLSKIVTPPLGGTAEQPISITELDHPLIIDIPLPVELQGKNNYVVYRYHGTEVQTITQTKADAEYIELSADGKSIKLHTKKFSTYAIGYTAASTPSKDDDSNDGGITTAPAITADSNAGGKVTISSDQKTATITPEEGYIIFDVLVDDKSVGAIATYTFTDSQKHKISAIFAEKTGVKRLAGVNRVDTALKIAKAANAGKVSHVILATAENYPDALAGNILAGKHNAPILLVGTDADDQQKVLDYVQSNLEATGTIYILGGFATVSQEIESSIKALGFGNIIRLGGKDRYETSAMIAAHMIKDNDGTPIVITTGEDYPDALSISSIASRHQYPILLTAKNELSSAVKQKIQDIKLSKIYLIGLEGSINPSVEEEIQQTAALAKGSIIRIGGADRFETSLAIARSFKPTGNYVSIATGNNFPDALSGSLYAARMNAPILLVNETISDQMTSYFKEEGIKGATIFGGEAVVGKKIFEELTNLVKP